MRLKLLIFSLLVGLSLNVAAQIKPIEFKLKYAMAMGVLKDSSSAKKLLNSGILINTKIGEIVTCQIPYDKVEIAKSYFKHLELSNNANSMRAQNFTALKLSKVDKAQNGKSNQLKADYSGKDVVVGIVDIGFQTDHPTFYDTEGKKYRVKRYWDQEDENGISPNGYSYGKECKDSSSIVNQLDFQGSHGTHVAGTAAGSGYSSKNLVHRGVAYDADLVFVKILHTNDTLGASALGDYIIANPAVIDAYQYIFDYAESVGKPAVINLSWGLHSGSHDGNSIFDKAVEGLVNDRPGRVIVGANGNSGETRMHFKYDFNQDTIRTIAFDRGKSWSEKESIYVDIWGTANTPFTFRFHIYDTSKNLIRSSPFLGTEADKEIHSYINSGVDSFFYTAIVEDNFIYNQKPNILFYTSNPDAARYLVILEMAANSGRIDAWNSGDAFRWSSGAFGSSWGSVDFSSEGYKEGDVTHTMIENGGTGKGTISVGAYINKSIWLNFDGNLFDNSDRYDALNIAAFSSEGPTVDGRIKPDISAPGQGITSAVNNLAYNPVPTRNRESLMDSTFFNGEPQYWRMFSGTSMAAPHVCGIVALMLEANPSLTSEQIKDILIATAVKDNYTGNTPNNKWGYGKVDALAALKKAENSLSLSRLTQDFDIYPNPSSSGSVNLKSKSNFTQITLLDAQGKLIEIIPLLGATNYLSLSTKHLSTGMYLISIKTTDGEVTEKLIIE